MGKIIPNIWFNDNALQAAEFYVSVFRKGSKVGKISYFTKAASKVAGMPEGSIASVEFSLRGQKFVGINGGPVFKPTPAISFAIECKDQREVDYFWRKLSEGGREVECGWLADRYGVSWQVIPKILLEFLDSKDSEERERVETAMLSMVKLDVSALRKAFSGRTG